MANPNGGPPPPPSQPSNYYYSQPPPSNHNFDPNFLPTTPTGTLPHQQAPMMHSNNSQSVPGAGAEGRNNAAHPDILDLLATYPFIQYTPSSRGEPSKTTAPTSFYSLKASTLLEAMADSSLTLPSPPLLFAPVYRSRFSGQTPRRSQPHPILIDALGPIYALPSVCRDVRPARSDYGREYDRRPSRIV
jgi:hypothetical protein